MAIYDISGNQLDTGSSEELEEELNDFKNGFGKGSISLSTANAVVKCIQSYIDHNSNFIYGQNGTATKYNVNGFIDSSTGKYRIDCSTLALLVVMGCDYDNSLYNLSNIQNKVNAMGYGYNPFWGEDYPWDAHDLYGTYTWQMCYEASKMGLAVDIVDRDFSGVQPGDIIYWGATSLPSTEGRFKRIRHCDIVIARVGEKDALVADAGAVPITVHLASTRTTQDDIAVVVRYPLGVAPKNTANVISTHYDTPVTSATFTLESSPARYTPVAVKIKVTQTGNTGKITLNSDNSTVFESNTFNAGTNGKTFEVIGCGFINIANATTLSLTAINAQIIDININYPATCVEL